jgi:hypothetical protein
MFIIIFLMPAVFSFLMLVSSLSDNSVLRVGGVFIGFTGMIASVIILIVNIILWVG